MARGNWRNWEGRDGAESYRGQKVPTRSAICAWCGHKWQSRVPKNAVCPKCNLNEQMAKDLLTHIMWQNTKFLRHKTLAMKGKFK